MTTQDRAFNIAKKRVEEYLQFRNEDVMQQHYEAMECQDCEAFLQLGIDAYHWLKNADEVIREAVYSGRAEFSEEADKAIRSLFIGWLEPCGDAEDWIKVQLDRGYHLDNMAEFRNCCEEVRAIVASFEEGNELPDAMKVLRDSALREHRDGETAEFV